MILIWPGSDCLKYVRKYVSNQLLFRLFSPHSGILFHTILVVSTLRRRLRLLHILPDFGQK